MKRTLTIAIAASLFATLLGGVAAATDSDRVVAATDTIATVDERPDVDPRHVLRRCRLLFGDRLVQRRGFTERHDRTQRRITDHLGIATHIGRDNR